MGEMESKQFGQVCAETLAEPGSNTSFSLPLCRPSLALIEALAFKISLNICMLIYNLFSPPMSPPFPSLTLSPHLLRLGVTMLIFASSSVILETAQNIFQVIALFSCTLYKGWKGSGKSLLASLCQWVGGVVSPLCRCHTGAPPDFG